MLPFFRGSNRSRRTTSLCSHVCTEGHIVSQGFGIGTWVQCLHWIASKTQPMIHQSWHWHAGTDNSFQWHCIWFTPHGLSEICLGWNFKPHYISSQPLLWLPCGLFSFMLLSIFSIIQTHWYCVYNVVSNFFLYKLLKNLPTHSHFFLVVKMDKNAHVCVSVCDF